tara:strand:- start:1676 stop:2146 length:471 start_codon:yes stop_codon:yes gene_type:complete
MPSKRSSPAPQLTGVPWAAHALVLLGSNIMATGLTALGAVCCFDPAGAAELYGIPLPVGEAGPAAIAWVRVSGLRDAGLGLATFALFAFHRPALRVFVPALLPIPLGDAALTWSAGGSGMGVATHLLGTVAIGVLAVLTWIDPTLGAGWGRVGAKP